MKSDRNFGKQIDKLEKALHEGLPGEVAHLVMAPSHRNQLLTNSKGPEFARKSSVLILLFPDEMNNVSTTFIKRVDYDGVHSGQIAFPGGKSEESDRDLFATALREAEEEIGIKAESVKIIGRLSDLFVPPSNFIISPVLAKISFKPDFYPDPVEVAEVFSVSLDHFLNPGICGQYELKYKDGQMIRVPGFYYNNHLIWGATAMILNELLQIARMADIIKD